MRFENIRGRENGTTDAWRFFDTHHELMCGSEGTQSSVCDNCVMDWSDYEFQVQEVNVPWVGIEYTVPDEELLTDTPVLRARGQRRAVVLTANRMIPWTRDDESIMVTMRNNGQTFEEIATTLGRSYRAVEQRYAIVMRDES